MSHSGEAVDVLDLFSSQEEADTRIFLHLCHINQLFQDTSVEGRIIIKSPDTDVLVLAVHYFPQFGNIKEMWMHTGTVTNTADLKRYIPVHDLCTTLHSTIPEILPAVHALTGCDTTSSFFCIGKRTMFRHLADKPEQWSQLSSLSSNDNKTALDASRRFVMKLYCSTKLKASDLDDLRVKLAVKKGSSLAKLPPCERSFVQHVKRAQWQTKLWTHSHVRNPDLGSPLNHGWELKGNILTPVYFEGPTASEVLDDLICRCSVRNKCSRDCTCYSKGLACTELCGCGNAECQNPLSVQLADARYQANINDSNEDDADDNVDEY